MCGTTTNEFVLLKLFFVCLLIDEAEWFLRADMSNQVLKLYRDLLRYGRTLRFTDKKYFKIRLRKEFKNNQGLTDKGAIDFHFQVSETLLMLKEYLLNVVYFFFIFYRKD